MRVYDHLARDNRWDKPVADEAQRFFRAFVAGSDCSPGPCGRTVALRSASTRCIARRSAHVTGRATARWGRFGISNTHSEFATSRQDKSCYPCVANAMVVSSSPTQLWRTRADSAIVRRLLLTEKLVKGQRQALMVLQDSIRLQVKLQATDAYLIARMTAYYRAEGRLRACVKRLGRDVDRVLRCTSTIE